MVHQPVYDGRGQLVVPEHRAPLAELDVGRHDHAPLLVAVAHDLEQQARPLDVERHVAELVQDEQVGPPQLLQHRLEGVRPVRLDEHGRDLGALRFGDLGQRVAVEVHRAALVSGLREHLGDRADHAGGLVADDYEKAAQSSRLQPR